MRLSLRQEGSIFLSHNLGRWTRRSLYNEYCQTCYESNFRTDRKILKLEKTFPDRPRKAETHHFLTFNFRRHLTKILLMAPIYSLVRLSTDLAKRSKRTGHIGIGQENAASERKIYYTTSDRGGNTCQYFTALKSWARNLKKCEPYKTDDNSTAWLSKPKKSI